MTYENATLKVQVHQLTENIEKLKSHMQRPKKINVDAKIIEKLATQSSTRYAMREKKKLILQQIFKLNLYLILLLQYNCLYV